jgi:feruloyl esterase
MKPSAMAWAVVLAGAAVTPALAQGASKPAADRCANMARATLPGLDLQITKAQEVPAAPPGTVRPSQFQPPLAVVVPAYCLVEGAFERRTGEGGKAYAIGFALAHGCSTGGREAMQAAQRYPEGCCQSNANSSPLGVDRAGGLGS